MTRAKHSLLVFALALGAVLTFAALAAADGQPPPPNDKGANPDKVAVCHKPGTPAEKTLFVPATAVAGHLGHGDSLGPCGAPPPPPPGGCADAVFDLCIDGDGVASPTDGGAGAYEVAIGDALASFPDVTIDFCFPPGGAPPGDPKCNGLDFFQDDGPAFTHTQGQDYHAEAPGLTDTNGNFVCTTAIRDAIHQLGQDCKVLDVDGDLADGEFVSNDCETGGCNFPTGPLRFKDLDGDLNWDSGEDLVRDTNSNGIFD